MLEAVVYAQYGQPSIARFNGDSADCAIDPGRRPATNENGEAPSGAAHAPPGREIFRFSRNLSIDEDILAFNSATTRKGRLYAQCEEWIKNGNPQGFLSHLYRYGALRAVDGHHCAVRYAFRSKLGADYTGNVVFA